jgi:hypothetical protein
MLLKFIMENPQGNNSLCFQWQLEELIKKLNESTK